VAVPLALGAVILLISLPSMFLAYGSGAATSGRFLNT
jgi:hypothetical protein